MKLVKKYSRRERFKRAITTFKEKTWVDGMIFSFTKRLSRAIKNYKDIPACMCKQDIGCSIHGTMH